MLTVLMYISLTLAVIGLLAGALMLWRIPAIPPGHKEKQMPAVSLIIPARNEAVRIPPLLESITKQEGVRFELIVIDDESTDDTARIAREYGAFVFNSSEIEGSWKGKSAACWQGAQKAGFPLLLFLDADTQFVHANSLRDLVQEYVIKGSRGILSLQPYHVMKKGYEQLSAVFNMIVFAGMNTFTPFQSKLKSAGSFGPCILTNREDYFSAGGHKEVGDAVMDDLVLGELYMSSGYPVRCVSGKGTILFRMYPEGMRTLVDGWSKSFATASKSTHPLVITLISIWIAGAFVSAALWASSLFLISSAWIIISTVLYVLYTMLLYWHARRIGSFHWLAILCYPLLFIFFTCIYIRSFYLTNIKHAVEWRGRKIRV
ncbi:MAG: glycosyltransferase family 2 protein [Cytobacillus gottheilii]|uniref:glycosyltransferase family 2 protein n=1 Tax=Cytobacillus gottheilii TaxID=859144 RepID=UPI0034646949